MTDTKTHDDTDANADAKRDIESAAAAESTEAPSDAAAAGANASASTAGTAAGAGAAPATTDDTRVQSLVTLRRRLIIAAIGLIVVNLVATTTGVGGENASVIGVALWAMVGGCFLGALIVGMMESAERRQLEPGHAKARKPDAKPIADAKPGDAKPGDAKPVDASDANRGDGSAAPSAESAPIEDEKARGSEPESTPLLHRGNPLRLARGGAITAVGSILAFLLMSHNGQLRVGVPLGLLFSGVAAWGVMDLLGTFDDPSDRVVATTELRALVSPIARVLVTLVLFGGALGLAAGGVRLPQWLWGIAVTIAFIALVASVFDLGVRLGPLAKDELGIARPLLQRHGFWVVTAAACLYFPMMGSFSLWDPWETHYGEVAREILSRDDWISLWWAQDGWFWSKPILDFWIQAIAMATLGVHYKPDQMLTGPSGLAPVMHPEWAVRAPVVLLTILAMYILYKGVAKAFGRRAGLLGALVLATVPDWFFLAHQTMTDMPFVASMTAAMGLVLLGIRAPADTDVKVYEVSIGRAVLRFSAWHLVFGAILLCAIPQILYLFSRNLELVLHGGGPHGFRPHWDEFKSGSAGNCGLPGNEACNAAVSASIPKSIGATPVGFGPHLLRTFGAFEPFLQALLWTGVLAGVLYMNWGERRMRRLFYLAAWFFAALATMAKGPAGFAIPMICAFAYVCTKKRWQELTRLELVSGLLIILCVALPWYVAMYVRHGSPFTDRLIFHDMFNRAFNHVHDTNEGDDTSFRFYLWQLGYALFPWTGLAPLGLMYWLRRSDSADNQKGDTSVLLVMWFVFAFGLFSFMGTKFHHYIFPAVPPVAMLIGIVLDDMIGDVPLAQRGSLPVYLLGVTAGVALSVLGLARLWPGSLGGSHLENSPLTQPSYPVGITLMIAGVAVLTGTILFFRGKPDSSPVSSWRAVESTDAPATSPSSPQSPQAPSRARGAPLPETPLERRRTHESVMIAGATAAAAFLLVLIGRDLIVKPEGADQPGAIRLLHLFTYNYRRPWPESLDFKAALTAFTIAAVVLSLAMSWHSIRRHLVVAFVALGVVWAVWGLDVYMVKTAPHWGQHEVIEAYYASRATTDEKLVAYQMNWKGENFYTGNHVPAFVSTGSNFTTWLKKEKDGGAHVMFFVTEHSRVGGLKGEVGAKSYREITDKAVCNKFVLVRAEL